LLVEITN